MIHKYLIYFLLIFTTVLYGQFETDKHVVGPSIGFSFLGSSIQYGINHEYGINLTDLGIKANGRIGIGGIFRFWTYSEETINVNRDYRDILTGLQANYHFYMPNDKVNTWLGVIFAYNFGSEDVQLKIQEFKIKDDESYGGFWIGAQAGSRYWLNKNLALSLRIGFGIENYGFIDFGFDYQIN